MSLSIKNEWYDDTRRVYIYYTVDEICSSLNCGWDKAMKLRPSWTLEKASA